MLTLLIILTIRKWITSRNIKFSDLLLLKYFKNNRNPVLVLLLYGLGFMPENGFSQKYTYSIYSNNKEIGVSTIEKSHQGNKTFYTLESTAQVDFLRTFTIYTRIDIIYKGAILHNAQLVRKVNEKERTNKRTLRSAKGYKLFDKGNLQKEHYTYPINKTTVDLFFHPPENIDSLYSENLQQCIPIRKVSENKYALCLPDGNRTYYSYSNGLCTEMNSQTMWGKVTLKLRKEHLMVIK